MCEECDKSEDVNYLGMKEMIEDENQKQKQIIKSVACCKKEDISEYFIVALHRCLMKKMKNKNVYTIKKKV